MEEPVFIKWEPGCVSVKAELSNADCDVKLPTEEQTNVKTEPEDVFHRPRIKEELEIQDLKIETYDEENNASLVSLNENYNLPACSELRPAISEHGKKLYKCNVCGRLLSSAVSLKEHLLAHSGQKPHSCNQCGKSFTHFSALKHHQRTHYEQKNLLCAMCGNCFRYKALLRAHLRTHSAEKPYSCSYCGKAFLRKYYMERHETVHTYRPTAKPHACNICGKVFGRRKALMSHFCIYK